MRRNPPYAPLPAARRVRRYLAACLLGVLGAGTSAADVRPTLPGRYYGEIGCGHCDTFYVKLKPEFEAAYGVVLDLAMFDILDPADYAACAADLAAIGQELRIWPVLRIGANAYQGNAAVEAGLAAEIAYYMDNGAYRPKAAEPTGAAAPPAATAPDVAGPPKFGWLGAAAVASAGLVDGINPCAFSTLLFFLSFLGLRGGDRRRKAIAAAAFIGAVFVVYTALGFGLLGGLRAAVATPAAKLAVNLAVSLAGAALGALSLRDARRAARHGTSAAAGTPLQSLSLAAPLRRASHWAIRRFAAGGVALGAAAAGGLVSLIELACTGQIYLPTLAYINRTAPSAAGVGLLLVYNIAFITPLVLVFLAFHLGAAHKRIQSWYAGRLVLVRVLSAGFFFAMAAFIWWV